MSRFLSLLLTAVLCCAAVTVAVKGQGRGGGRGQQAAALPDGPGRDFVQATCTACHGVNQITGSAGYSSDGWQDLIGSMVELPDAQLGQRVPVPGDAFPPEAGPRAGDRSGAGDGHVPGVDRPDARSGRARSAAAGGRHRLVGRPVSEHRRSPRPEHG